MNHVIPLKTPFNEIALAFSGGGFRAASFSLGALSYLYQVPFEANETAQGSGVSLLDRVTFISSASGGTFTASLFSSMRKKGAGFDEIYRKLFQVLNGEKLLDRALKILNDDEQWQHPGNPKSRNLINAFAKAYDQEIFKGETFGIYWSPDGKQEIEVCFNATEFKRGLQFRFQADGKPDTYERVGNRYIYFTDRHVPTLKCIKLADILAASSCFPGGFEPITYPEDFAYEDSHGHVNSQELREALRVTQYNNTSGSLNEDENLALMDGGIADNQGLYSAMLADNRRRENNRKEFDLFIITDVASYFMGAYETPEPGKDAGWKQKTIREFQNKIRKTLFRLNVFNIFVVVLFIASLTGIFTARPAWLRNLSLVVFGFFTALLAIQLVFNVIKRRLGVSKILKPDFDFKPWVLKQIPSLKEFSHPILDKLFAFFTNTPLGILREMILCRANSVLTMVSDINLKHVRRLIFNPFYQDPQWEHRRCTNFIYELSRQNEPSRTRRLKEYHKLQQLTEKDVQILTPSGKIMDVAEEARLVGTTLWFDKDNEEKLRMLIACGQFSTCVNLLLYVMQLENNPSLEFSAPVKINLSAIKAKLLQDWDSFKNHPFFLVEQYDQKFKK